MLTGQCNWCGHHKQLLPGKKFCARCGAQGQECTHCHRPLPPRFYTLSNSTCNACCKKHAKQREKRKRSANSPLYETQVGHTEPPPKRANLLQANQTGSGQSTINDNQTVQDQAARDEQQITTQGHNQKDEAQPAAVAQSALAQTAKTTSWTPQANEDLLKSMKELEEQIKDTLQSDTNQHRGIKWSVASTVCYVKTSVDGEVQTNDMTFRTSNAIATSHSDIDRQIPEAFQDLYRQSQDFQDEGSGWSLDRVGSFTVQTVAYQPLMGSSYIKLPEFLVKKKALLNIQNEDNKCIVWCILAHLHPQTQHAYRVKLYMQYENELNVRGVTFPTELKDIPKIEKNNSLSVNVLGYDKTDGIYPLYNTKQVQEKHINLLLVKQGDKSHYCLVRSMSRLLQTLTKHKAKSYYCNNCLHGCVSQQVLEKHQEFCLKQRSQRIEFPKETTLTFKHFSKKLKMPYIFYADFECYTTKIDACVNNPQRSSTTAYQRHEPSGFCLVGVGNDGNLTESPFVYRGTNVIDKFFQTLLEKMQMIQDVLSNIKPMLITTEEQAAFHQAVNCHICSKELGADRVRDHDHITGVYRGAAHNECNINFKYPTRGIKGHKEYVVPVVFHNLRGYDGHLLMESLGKYKARRLEVIPNNSERYISFSLLGLRFIDSLQFMNASLEKLVSNLANEGKDKFKVLCKEIVDEQQQDLLLRKGVYPYDYVDSPKKLEELQLPPIEAFYSRLYEQDISTEDYKHAQNVWQEFNCRTLGDYHDIYLKSDVLLLADVFERFRSMCLENYGLDPAHYYTLPGLSWDSMLKHTQVQLELMTDPDMHLMIEAGVRGGVSVITKKLATANNPLVDDYDSNKDKNWLIYLDANNLYGWAMSQKLPEKEFDWLTEQQLEEMDVTQMADDAETGYILEVDLEYPPELHDTHNDLPLAPESCIVQEDELSPYTRQLKENINMKGRPHSKLIPNLRDKKHYVIHYRNLKQYIALGMRLKKIHRAIKFHQSYWLRKYISLNTEKRKAAQNAFEKDLFKLFNNSIFGKTMENVRGRINFELVHQQKRLKKLAAKPTFHRTYIFNDDLVGVHNLKTKIMLDKPTYVGFSILELSKTLMFDFHYNYIKVKYGDNAQLCFTDTDSLLYDIKTEDIYKDMKQDSHLFDFSDYSSNHPMHSNANKKVIGKMKDETAGVPVREFIGLRSKMYSLKYGNHEKQTAKGIKTSVVRKRLRHSMYRDVLLNEHVTLETMNVIRSHKHQPYTEAVNKLALSAYDDKRYVLPNKTETRAHGHYANVL